MPGSGPPVSPLLVSFCNLTISACQCYGRASGCVYDPDVDEQNLSIDVHGYYSGGGVCQYCQVRFYRRIL